MRELSQYGADEKTEGGSDSKREDEFDDAGNGNREEGGVDGDKHCLVNQVDSVGIAREQPTEPRLAMVTGLKKMAEDDDNGDHQGGFPCRIGKCLPVKPAVNRLLEPLRQTEGAPYQTEEEQQGQGDQGDGFPLMRHLIR